MPQDLVELGGAVTSSPLRSATRTPTSRLGARAHRRRSDAPPVRPSAGGWTLSRILNVGPVTEATGHAARPAVERLVYRIEEVAVALGVSRRAIERVRTAGRFPSADKYIGKMPLWRVETIRSYLERGGPNEPAPLYRLGLGPSNGR